MSFRGYFWACPCPKVSPTRHPKDIFFWVGHALVLKYPRHVLVPKYPRHVLVPKYPGQDILWKSFFSPGCLLDNRISLGCLKDYPLLCGKLSIRSYTDWEIFSKMNVNCEPNVPDETIDESSSP
ncbi:Uncharacterized protein APZ42_018293 [Daphnia magna]|uniref:Uncharacterized protein n=1 Tax=Daphnia magna TaxID=35525 RepID=A0A164Z7C4_9CRUS|nr:Uncharacterized protein APZ42_018293 [Daphnia magna]